jgi:hypothetical protein
MRNQLQRVVEARIRAIWYGKGISERAVENTFSEGRGIESLQRQILDLVPESDGQRWFKATALTISNEIAETRWVVVVNAGRYIQIPVLVVLAFWVATIFTGFGLFASRNPSIVVILATCALCVAGAIFLIVEMDQPYGGFVSVPFTAVEAALDQLNKP